MPTKSQRLELARKETDEKSTPRNARAYEGIFSLDQEKGSVRVDVPAAYTTSASEIGTLLFLIWFVSVI